MRAVLINAKDRTVTDVEVDGRKNVLHQWYKLLNVRMVEVALYINEQEDSILVDEEGMLELDENTCFFVYEGGHQPFAGNGLIVGKDEDGESISCHVTADEVRSKVKFLNIHEARQAANPRPEPEPERPTMQVSREDLTELKKLYAKAVKDGKPDLEFKGHQFVVGYVKYLIEYLDGQFNTPKK